MESLLAQWFKFGSPRLGDRKGVVGVAGVDLIRAVAAGDQDALRELYRLHSRELFVFILRRLGDRQLAEETLQDVMLAVWHGARNTPVSDRIKPSPYAGVSPDVPRAPPHGQHHVLQGLLCQLPIAESPKDEHEQLARMQAVQLPQRVLVTRSHRPD